MYYIFGDIHGCLDKLHKIFFFIKGQLNQDDTLIFLGDYIDRGMYSCEVVEYLITVSGTYNSIFLKGNHEDMLLKYLAHQDKQNIFIQNGGGATIKSYTRNYREFMIPESHHLFYNNLKLYFETDDFIAVHAGFNPKIDNIHDQSVEDILWIRDTFYRHDHYWNKSIIFGHTPVSFISNRSERIFVDESKNIIGIDTGAVYGGKLTCLRWPDKKIYQS